MSRLVKIVAGNILVFLVIMWSANLFASIIIDGQYVLEQWFLPVSKKAGSPSLGQKAGFPSLEQEAGFPSLGAANGRRPSTR